MVRYIVSIRHFLTRYSVNKTLFDTSYRCFPSFRPQVWQQIHVPVGFVESETHVAQMWRSGAVRTLSAGDCFGQWASLKVFLMMRYI